MFFVGVVVFIVFVVFVDGIVDVGLLNGGDFSLFSVVSVDGFVVIGIVMDGNINNRNCVV